MLFCQRQADAGKQGAFLNIYTGIHVMAGYWHCGWKII